MDPVLPLDVLLAVMRDRFASRDYDAAVAIAKAVAPFVHPKPVTRMGGGGALDTLRDQQLVELCGSRPAGDGDPQADPDESGSVVPFRPV